MRDACYWIDRLGLQRHPEGGWYGEVYRATEPILPAGLPPRYEGPRAAGTAIYFMLAGEDFSAFHRLQSDEIWHFYAGCSLTIHRIDPQGVATQAVLGPDAERGQQFQVVIPHGYWFAAVLDTPGAYCLMGCTVAPGFDFRDFELGARDVLVRQFPQHADLIRQLTRK
jgi:hypothetical protein